MKKLFIIGTISWLLQAAEQKLTLPDLLKQYPEQESYDLVDWKQCYRQKYLPCEYEPLKSQLASIAPCLMQQIKDQQWDEIFKDYDPQYDDDNIHNYMNLVTTVAQKINHTQLLQEIKKRIERSLHLAGRYGFVALITELSSSTTIDSCWHGSTMLHLACKQGHAKAVRALLAAKATVDSYGYCGHTPFMAAARKGHIKCCQILLEAGAQVNAQNEFGVTALYEAVEDNKSDIVQFLLAYNADPNLAEMTGITPLIMATRKGHYNCVLKLIQAGAYLNAQDKRGNTALDKAKNESIKTLLIQAGAKKSSE